ncbi:recombinase family protein [Streptosporangium sp. NPDC000095]|uniref:recombinase family protein n=1 Tax=Streptosporangium sp. NPDC000095 TaxID=3366184 RepID=UPI0036818139
MSSHRRKPPSAPHSSRRPRYNLAEPAPQKSSALTTDPYRASRRAIITNPRYTGRQVWNRQRKDEVLIDVDDVGLGHATKLRWNTREEWVWSDGITQPPIVTAEGFEVVQELLAGLGVRLTHSPQQMKNPGQLYV